MRSAPPDQACVGREGSTGSNRHRLQRMALAVTLVGLLAALFAAVPAWAATTYNYSGEFAGGGFLAPTDIAVDNSTGNIFVADSGNARIQVFSAEPPGTYLATIETGSGSIPHGIAIDQASGALYVSDGGLNRIVRYLSDGAPTPTYTVDPSFESPVAGGEAGQIGSFSSAIAVDPATHDLLVADVGNHRVSRYTPTGSFVSSFDGSDAPAGAFHELADIAVDDTGAAYVVDITASPLVFGAAVVEKFAADGTAAGELQAGGTPGSVAFDSKSGNVVVVGNQTFLAAPRLFVFNDDTLGTEVEFPAAVGSAVPGVSVDGSSGRLYAVTDLALGFAGTVGVQAFDSFVLPSVTIDAPAEVTPRSVHISGTVDPSGVSTSYHFEYSRDAGAHWTAGADSDAGEGVVAAPVDSNLTGLTPNSQYLVRLVAVNVGGGTATSGTRSFSTGLSAPDASTGLATDRTSTEARLHGTVSAYGLQTTYRFEYGLTTDYGSLAPSAGSAVGGVGFEARPVSQPIAGLQAGATYHYRLTASSSAGETLGTDRTFTVPASSTTRAYELVSPADKGGVSVVPVMNFFAQADGEGLAYATKNVMRGDGTPSEGAPLLPTYFARRGTNGWSSRPLDPPQLAERQDPRFYTTLGVAADGSKAFVMSGRALAPGAIEGDSNLYLRDIATGSYTTIGTTPGLEFISRAGYVVGIAPAFVGGTADFSHVLFNGLCCSFLPGAPTESLYDFTDGQLHLVSRQPDGAPTALAGNGAGNDTERDPHRISDDGTRIFFQGADGVLYVRIDGEETKALSVSHLAGEPDVPVAGTFGGASRDGHIVFMVGQDLTDDSLPGVSTLYRVDVDSGNLTAIAHGVSSGTVFHVSANGSYVYFQSTEDLGEGGTPGNFNIYVWHAGTIHRVLTLKVGGPDFGWPFHEMSPNGRYLAFGSRARLTDYDPRSSKCLNEGTPTSSCLEIYRYDAAENTLLCASCGVDGAPPVSDASIGVEQAEFNRSFARVMLDDGRVFFDTGERLTAADTNSKRDVYSFDGDLPTLISAGTGDGDSQLADVSSDGRDVFFTTQDRLVKIDADSALDVYDARVGGGIPSQNADPSQSQCAGEGCRGAVAPAPPSQPSGSEAWAGSGNSGSRAHRRCGKGRRTRKVNGKARCVKQPKKHRNGRQSR